VTETEEFAEVYLIKDDLVSGYIVLEPTAGNGIIVPKSFASMTIPLACSFHGGCPL
jgi:hypothetical protein